MEKRKGDKKKWIKMVLDLKKVFSNVLVIVGIYYLLVGLQIINAKIIWLEENFPAPINQVLILGIILVIIGLLLNKRFMRRLKNVLR